MSFQEGALERHFSVGGAGAVHAVLPAVSGIGHHGRGERAPAGDVMEPAAAPPAPAGGPGRGVSHGAVLGLSPQVLVSLVHAQRHALARQRQDDLRAEALRTHG